MAEKTNITVISSATPEQLERALRRINQLKYPKHAETAERRLIELRMERRAA